MKENQPLSNVAKSLQKKPIVKGVALAMGLTLISAFAAPVAYALPAPGQQTSVSQVQNVYGTVKDVHGEPLPGATVTVEGTKTVTATDADGQFNIKAAKGQILVITYVGMQPYRAAVGSGPVNAVMDSANELDEVVVVGYGTVRKADLAGAVSVIDDKAFRAQPITQISDALQGRVSGVNIVSDGLPGSTPRIRIRGANSINKSNDPLYVVDGMVRESGLDGINPEDIASLQILKDASSTAIYGSRGANGVVIVTTKTGHAGESKIILDASVGWSQATHLPEIMGAREYARALVDYNGVPESEVADYLNGSNPGVDWKDEIFRTGMVQNYKLAFTKGTDAMQLYVSGNYMRHEGILKNTQFERFGARVNLRADITNWLNVTADVNLTHGEGKGAGELVAGGYNPVYLAFNYSPTMSVYDQTPGVPEGTYAKDPYSSINESPLASLSGNNSRRRDVVNGHLDLRFKLCPGLTFTTSNGIDYWNSYGYGFSSNKRWAGATNSASNSNNNRWLLQTSNNFTYIGKFKEKHNLTATLVWEATKFTQRTMGISGSDFISESVGWDNIAAAGTIGMPTNGYTGWTLLSGVARVIYNYDDRYMVTGTLRADGSSRLSRNKWCWFPSIAAAWTISNEKFFEPASPYVSNLKLRASFGIIGNQDITPYQTLATMTGTTTYYGTNQAFSGFWANKTATPDLKWEKTKQYDVGIDASFLNGRIGLTVDWYYKRTHDALLNTTNPGYLGGSSYMVNAGEVENTGWDFGITANIIQGGDWTWTTAINASVLRNEVKKMTTLEPILYSSSMQSIVTNAAIIKEGEAIGSLYGFRWAGIDGEGYDTYYTKDGEITRNPSADDREVLGKATPSFTFGWNNTVSWKNWSLNAFFNAAFGAKRLNIMRYAMCSKIGNSRMFTSPDALSGMGSEFPNPNVANNQYLGNSSKWVEKADYFRLENIALSYDFRKSQTKFADIHLSFSIQNLFTITGYKGLNPASFSYGSDTAPWIQGLDFGTNAVPRTYTVGARFTF